MARGKWRIVLLAIRHLLFAPYQFFLNPAVMLLSVSPVGRSLIVPVRLSGVPNSFCSALTFGSTRSSLDDRLAPAETAVAVGRSTRTVPSPDSTRGAAGAPL